MKKLTLNKRVISNLTREEAGKVVGGATFGCQTQIIEGCDANNTWYGCTGNCSGYCGATAAGTTCPPITQPYPGGLTCDGCQSDYGCPPATHYTQCGTICSVGC